MLPSIPPRAYALGTPEQRSQAGGGGLLARIWWDTLLPWTKPSSRPSWWPSSSTHGLFEGWEHNMFSSPSGLPNFPSDRPFDCVVLDSAQLADSVNAPYALKYVNGIATSNSDDSAFPWTMAPGTPPGDPGGMGVTRCLDWYINHYLDASTYIIFVLPIREIINVLGDPSDSALYKPHTPSLTDGMTALTNLIWYLWNPAHGVSTRILGLIIINEPDGVARAFANANKIAGLTAGIQEQQRLARASFDSTYAAFSQAEQEARLVPAIINFADAWHAPTPPQFTPAEYSRRISEVLHPEIRVMFSFDRYPYFRTFARIKSDGCSGSTDCGTYDSPNVPGHSHPCPIIKGLTLADPVKSLKAFVEFQSQINGTLKLGDPGYKAVINWLQTSGYPWRPSSVPAGTEKNYQPAPTPPCDYTNFDRYLQKPTGDKFRYYLWASWLLGSEGFAAFSQSGLADADIVGTVIPIMEELQYFGRLRWERKDLTSTLGVVTIQDSHLPSYAELPPVVQFLFYQHPPSGPPAPWLFILNLGSSKLTTIVSFPKAYIGRVLVEYRSLSPISLSVIGDPPVKAFELGPWSQDYVAGQGYALRIFSLL